MHNNNCVSMSKCHIPNSKYEVIAAIGRRTGQRKKILVIAAYIPPSYTAEENKSCIEYLSDTITSLKNRYNDPHIFVGVDFNKRDINKTVKDYPDLRTVQTGPTRGNAVLDIIATSAHKELIEAETFPPVENEDGTPSDHRVVLMCVRMPRVPSYTVSSCTYFQSDEDSQSAHFR